MYSPKSLKFFPVYLGNQFCTISSFVFNGILVLYILSRQIKRNRQNYHFFFVHSIF